MSPNTKPTCWAESLFRSAKDVKVLLHRYAVILQGQMRRLVMVVICARQRHRCQQVKTEHAVWVWVVDWLALRHRPSQFAVYRFCTDLNIVSCIIRAVHHQSCSSSELFKMSFLRVQVQVQVQLEPKVSVHNKSLSIKMCQCYS